VVRIFPPKYILKKIVVYWGILYITVRMVIKKVRVKKSDISRSEPMIFTFDIVFST
jgi:hypothetical protein